MDAFLAGRVGLDLGHVLGAPRRPQTSCWKRPGALTPHHLHSQRVDPTGLAGAASKRHLLPWDKDAGGGGRRRRFRGAPVVAAPALLGFHTGYVRSRLFSSV